MLMLCYRCLSTLFFSPIFTVDSCCYSTFQFFHPIFYSTEDRVQFIHTLENYKLSKESAFYSYFILGAVEIYGFREWWERINYGPLYKVYTNGTEVHTRFDDANELPHYIRCAHHHFLHQRVNFFFFSMNLLFLFFYLNCLLLYRFDNH